MRVVYTDYPVRELGDKPNEYPPTREFILLSYDGDKYCTIRHIESKIELKVKSGYLFSHWDIYDKNNSIPKKWLREVEVQQ
tara:strand:+ start:467 stop:709 length:243 start_codon:yes stop_codon:yes gene_type:complete